MQDEAPMQTDHSNTPNVPTSGPSMGTKNKKLSKLRRTVLKHVWLVRGVLLVGVASVITLIILGINSLIAQTQLGEYLALGKAFAGRNVSLLSSTDSRVTVLVLGKGGKDHEAPDLTDTLMVASFSLNTPGEIDLISLPRDIWIDPLKAKINSLYYYGNLKKPGGGLVLAKSTVEEILGTPIHYAIVVDFSGFEQVINALGGVDVEVATPFVDTKYPIAGKETDECGGDLTYACRYETISFDQGTQHMDGATTLKFTRSRNAQGDEGTDLARAKRQQLVMVAIKNKLTSRQVLTSPKTLTAVYEAALAAMETDLDRQQLAVLARLALDARDNVTSHVLPEDLIYHPPDYLYSYQYVFIPSSEDGSWSEIQEWVKSIISN